MINFIIYLPVIIASIIIFKRRTNKKLMEEEFNKRWGLKGHEYKGPIINKDYIIIYCSVVIMSLLIILLK